MIPLGTLRRLGVVVEPGFLDAPLCRDLHREIAGAPGTAAEVYRGSHGALHPEFRRASDRQVRGEVRAQIQRRFDAMVPAVASRFGADIRHLEGVSFLAYEPGGYFRPHRDRADRDARSGGNDSWRRRASAVLFLSRSAEPAGAGDHTGGELILYGLIDEPEWRDTGFAVPAEPGTLVVFDANVLHEVTPVTAGVRTTAVDWFY